jgi:hypothetical protein
MGCAWYERDFGSGDALLEYLSECLAVMYHIDTRLQRGEMGQLNCR